MHLHAVSDCLPISAAAGHPNYLKSAYLYLQKIMALETEYPKVFQKFMSGYHVIRRNDKFWAGSASLGHRLSPDVDTDAASVLASALLHLLSIIQRYPQTY